MTNPTDNAVRLAIVGSTTFGSGLASDGDRSEAEWIIAEAISWFLPEVVISGGAIGIDQMAAEMARSNNIKVVEHLPKNRRWAPDGFKDRNLLIAQDCTHLVVIRHRDSKTYGSGWTADQAEKMGRQVQRYLVPTEAAAAPGEGDTRRGAGRSDQ